MEDDEREPLERSWSKLGGQRGQSRPRKCTLCTAATVVLLVVAAVEALTAYAKPEPTQLPTTLCPSSAEVRSPMLADTSGCCSASCGRKEADASVGFMLTTISGRLSEPEATLRQLMHSTTIRPRLVYVGVDEAQRSFKWLQMMPAVFQRLCSRLVKGCSREPVHVLEALAQHLQGVASGAPVLVERINMRSCVGVKLVQEAFACSTTALGPLLPRCWMPFFHKNTVAYFYGIMRLRACVRYSVHIDSDITLHVHAPQQIDWVMRSVEVLASNQNALHTIMPTNPSEEVLGSCRTRHHNLHSLTTRCNCSGVKLGSTHSLSLLSNVQPACGFARVGEYSGRDGTHFSFQAFVIDVDRFTRRVWPLPIQWESANLHREGGPFGHIEAIMEKATGPASSQDVPSALFLGPSELGVHKEHHHRRTFPTLSGLAPSLAAAEHPQSRQTTRG